MSKAAFSIKAFAFYLVPTGVGLLLMPNLLLSVFLLPDTQEVWLRVVGVLLINIGVYYWFAAAHDATQFFVASVYTRTFVFIAFCLFVFSGLAEGPLILIGAVDLAGAIWTFQSIRQDRSMSGVGV